MHHGVGKSVADAQTDARVMAKKRGDSRRQQNRGHRREGGDIDGAGVTVNEAVELTSGVGLAPQYMVRQFQELLTGRGQFNGASTAVQQGDM